MIIQNFDVMGVSVPEFETDAPPTVDRHRPLIAAVAFQLMEADTIQRAQVLERLGDVECQQKIDGSFKVQPGKSVRFFLFPNLAACRISPGDDHGKNIVRNSAKVN
jgi:hypothetical protein